MACCELLALSMSECNTTASFPDDLAMVDKVKLSEDVEIYANGNSESGKDLVRKSRVDFSERDSGLNKEP